MGVAKMAKRGRGRPASEEKSFKTLGYRVTEPYLEWITKVAGVNRTSVSGLIDQAVAKYAREMGITEPPPDRTG